MDIVAAFQDHEGMTHALMLAAQDAQRLHKAMGVPLVVCRDGKVVLVSPEEIVIMDVPPLPPRKA